MLLGTTSAYAENTMPPASSFVVATNYLRVRGEYFCITTRAHLFQELPPRTRRILDNSFLEGFEEGTTSAYAENTSGRYCVFSLPRNYLRVRGEYCIVSSSGVSSSELPPRTRRIPWGLTLMEPANGTTSAYAENT